MALPYPRVVIIFNPNSTGAAAARARRLYGRLQRRKVTGLELIETEYAGHAEVLAYEKAKKYKNPLIVSVSGDGGYNEVINGALRAVAGDGNLQPVCAILPAGNANDHRRSVKKQSLIRAIMKAEPEAIDILRLQVQTRGASLTRYAHSYIGLGLSSEAAAELNRHELTRWKELSIVFRIFLGFAPFRIDLHDGSSQLLDSLVFANIHQMSKVIKLGDATNLHDGLFRVVAIPHMNRLRLFGVLVSIAIFGFKHPPQRSSFEFRLPATQLVHLDGEVSTIPGGSTVKVEAIREAILTLR